MKYLPFSRRNQRGVTLIELMVSLLIGMVLSLAMLLVMSSSEGRKRTITSTSDVNQAGNYAGYLLDQWIRNAGNGFTKAAPYAFGCALKAYYANTQILPSSTTLPSPFASVSTGTVGEFRLAPVLILPGQTTPSVSGRTSDVLVIMGGTSNTAGTPMPFSAFASDAQINLLSNTGFSANDLLLVTPTQPTSANYDTSTGDITAVNVQDCAIEQVSDSLTTTTTLPLDGTYHNSGTALGSMPMETSVMALGNVTNGNAPQFLLVGVGDNNTLYSYDLLNTAGESTRARTAVARADGIFEMHALYGVDADCDGVINSSEWVAPTQSPYTASELMAGTTKEKVDWPADADARKSACSTLTTANDYLQRILAIRVGLILRTSLPEKDVVSTSNITLFSDLGTSLTHTRALKTDTEDSTRLERHYRYRTLEITIPLRNALTIL